MPLRIVCTDYAKLGERCQIAGVTALHGHRDYEEGAIVPTGDWRPINNDEAASFRAPGGARPSEVAELVSLSALPHQQAEPAPWWTVTPPFTPTPTTRYANHATTPGDVLTATVNFENGKRLGLHLDNWDRLPFGQRHLSRRRLCLNAGPGPRYLLLGDADALTICRHLHRDHGRRYPHTSDIRAYVHTGQPLRCLRVRLEPGEGYIAPTELLPHDGSTTGFQESSTAAFWLDHWPVGTLPSLVTSARPGRGGAGRPSAR
ncbi:hypothetical protein [Streptomyces sp. FH025]|uniref:hypothetical protein n=1 Tax=Streptomyces sp. FH025 TaxID=2815937 RepID=UPI001A9F6EB4|nr:hypothetical protein [Streptomyces sp. FH025]MBO1416715.1 hypothetical protein [Streptomyces sp. FH025]